MTDDTPSDAPTWWDDVEEGSTDDALVSERTHREYIKHNGKGYWFDVRDPPWKVREEFVDDNLEIGENGRRLDTDGYYIDVLEWMIQDMSVGGDKVRTFLAGVEPGLGDKLRDLAPKPFGAVGEGAEGNSEDSPAESE